MKDTIPIGNSGAVDGIDEKDFLRRMESNVDNRNREAREELLQKVFISMIDAFKSGNDFEGKDTFGNLIFIPCPPKLAIEGLDITKAESVRFLYTLYLIGSSRASLVGEVVPLKESVRKLVQDGISSREFGL